MYVWRCRECGRKFKVNRMIHSKAKREEVKIRCIFCGSGEVEYIRRD